MTREEYQKKLGDLNIEAGRNGLPIKDAFKEILYTVCIFALSQQISRERLHQCIDIAYSFMEDVAFAGRVELDDETLFQIPELDEN